MSEEVCLLCLENIDDTTEQIDIDSAEGRTQEMQQIIEKYFKKELDGVMLSMKTHLLCRTCWNAVSNFHEFCLRVQRAHLTSVNILRLSSAHEIATIKKEYEVNEEASLNAVPEQRRRGRPRRQTATKSATNMQELPECKVVIEKMDMSCIENKEEIQIPIAEHDIKLENNISVEDMKHEALQEECMDADYTPDDTDSDYMATSMSPKDCLDDSDVDLDKIQQMLKMTKKKKKKNCSVNSNKSAEADEYIAKHFKLSCCLCNSPLADFSELKKHFRIQHKTSGYVLCCGKKLLKRGVLVDHIHMHQDPDYFKCTRCDRSLSDRRCLDLHIKNHDLNHERIYKCNICPKSYFRQSILLRHIATHMPDEQRKHACPQCDKTFPTNYLMNQHLKLVHLNLYAKICDVCGKSIKGREALRRHMDQHAGVVCLPIQCQLCSTTLTNKYALARHMKTMHTEEYQTPQTCPICAKVSPSLRAHRSHIKNVHIIKPKHVCPTCGKSFKVLKNFKEHMTTHTGEVLYTCTYCPRTFGSSANMYSHRKKMHPKEWAENHLQKGIKV